MRKSCVGFVVMFSLLNFAICGGYIYLKEWKRWGIAFSSLVMLFMFGALFHEEGMFPLLLVPFVLAHIIICTIDCVILARKDNRLLDMRLNDILRFRRMGKAVRYLMKDFKEDDKLLGRKYFHY